MKIEIRKPNISNPTVVDRVTLRAEITESTCSSELDTLRLLSAACHGFILDDGTSIVIAKEEKEFINGKE